MSGIEVREIIDKEVAKLRKEIEKLEVRKITEEDPTTIAKHIAKLEKFKKQYSKLLAALELLPPPPCSEILAQMP